MAMKDIAAGFAYSDLLTAKGLTFHEEAQYRVQIRSGPGQSGTLYATLKSVAGAQPGITFVNDKTLRLTMSAEQTAPMVKSVSLDIVREDSNPDEYLGGQQTIKVVQPVTAPAAETQPPTGPLITSVDPSGSFLEGQAISGTLTADRSVTWSKSGIDAWAVTLNTTTGAWFLEATDFETKAGYAFTFTATDGTGQIAQQPVAIAITDVVEVPTPTLTLTGPLTYAADATSGTTVANIGNVPAGATPTITPNDGRLAVAGNATDGWRVVKGLAASTAGSFTLTVSAAGANQASATVTVTAAASTAPASSADFTGSSYSGDFTGSNDVLSATSASPRPAMARNGAMQTGVANTLRRSDTGVRASSAQPTQMATFPGALENAAWSKTNVTADPTAYLAPDGVSQFSKVVPTTDNVPHILFRTFSNTTNQPVAVNDLVEFDPEYPFLLIDVDTNNGANSCRMVYDLAGGRLYDGPHRIGASPPLIDERITRLRPNLLLIQALYGAVATTSTRVRIVPLPASIYPDAAASPVRTDSTNTLAIPTYAGDGVKGQRHALNVFTAAGLDRLQDMTFGTNTATADQLAAGPALLAMLSASSGAIRIRLRDTFSPLDKTGLPLLLTNTGEAWLAQHSDTAVKATIGGVTMVTQLGSGSWMSSTVDVVLAWSGTTFRLCANNGPVATMTATKPAITAARLLSNADGSAVADGTILSIEHRKPAITDAQMQDWSAGLLDDAETFAFWHDSASIAVSAGKLAASTSFAGAGTLTPSASNEPTVIVEADALTKWVAYRSGKRATMASPGLINGTKKARFDFQARPTDAAALAASEFGANVILSQNDFSIRHVDTGMRVILPHATTALQVDFPNCWFEGDAACYSVTIDPMAADANKVELRRNDIVISGKVTTASAGVPLAQTGTFVVGAKSNGTEYGAFDLCALAGCEITKPRSSGAATHDRITKRHYDQVARCQLVAGGDHYEAIFAGSDGAGLAPDYINVPDVSVAGANTLASFAGTGGDNKLIFALFGGPTTATGDANGFTQPRNLDVQHQIITGMGANGLPIFAGRKINYGTGSRNPHHNLIEHVGLCPAYHTAGANRIGTAAQNADGLSFAGDLPSSTSNSFEASHAPEKCFARNLLVWGSQDEAISMTGWARHIYAMDNLIIAMVTGQRPGGSTDPTAWWSNESSHGYPGLIGYGANACFAARELAFDVDRRMREWDAADKDITLTIKGRQQNTFAFGRYSPNDQLGFTSFGSKGEHAADLIANDIGVDFIAIGNRNGRAQGLNRLPLIANLWNPVMVSRIAGRVQGVATAFIGGPMFTDSQVFGAMRKPGGEDVVGNNSVSRQSLRTSPAFIESRTQPPMLTARMLRRELRERAGPWSMPAWVKQRMDTIERNDPYSEQGMLTSAYNDRAGLLGNTVTQVDPAAFAATYLTPRGLAWGTRASAEVLLPAYRELQELFAKRGAARFGS